MHDQLKTALDIIEKQSKTDLNQLSLADVQIRQNEIKQCQKLTSEISSLLSKEFKRNNRLRIDLLKKSGPSKLSNAQLGKLVQEQAELIKQLQLNQNLSSPPKEGE